jgi:hypothetical protein
MRSNATTIRRLIDKSLQTKNPLQNISAIDRTARIIIGMLLISVWFVIDISTVNMWLALLPLIGIIPLMSGIMGWCPVHAMFNTKSCGTDSHNTCGTLPFQLSRLFHK